MNESEWIWLYWSLNVCTIQRMNDYSNMDCVLILIKCVIKVNQLLTKEIRLYLTIFFNHNLASTFAHAYLQLVHCIHLCIHTRTCNRLFGANVLVQRHLYTCRYMYVKVTGLSCVFSSPEPKARVSYCRPFSSVVRRPSCVVRRPSCVVRRPSSVVRKLFTFSSSSWKRMVGF